MNFRAFGLLALFFCVSSTAAFSKSDAIKRIPVTPEFEQVDFSADGKGHYYVANVWIGVLEGEIHLCGVGVYTDSQLRSIANRILRDSYMRIDGRKVVTNFRFFEKASSVAGLSSGSAACKSSGVVYQKGKKYDIDFGGSGHTYYY